MKKICPCCNRKIINYQDEYCNKCAKEKHEKEKERYIKYKSNRTDKDEQLFYSRKDWKILRDSIKNKYKGLCLYSLFVYKKIVFADCVHHIIEIKEDWQRRLDSGNLIPLSAEAHRIIHSVYKENENSKKQMQELLFKLIAKKINVEEISKYE